MRYVSSSILLIGIGCGDSMRSASPPADTTLLMPASISIFAGQRSLNVMFGESLRLTVVVRDGRGDTLPTPASLRIVSSDSTIVRVDSGYVVKTVGTGSARIVGSVLGARGPVADSLTVGVACTLELSTYLTPAADTLAVGESFTPAISLLTCGGQLQVQDTFRWAARDTALIRVDSTTGRTTGLKPGSTSVLVRGTKYGTLGEIFVVVR